MVEISEVSAMRRKRVKLDETHDPGKLPNYNIVRRTESDVSSFKSYVSPRNYRHSRNGFQRGINDQRVSFVKRVKVKDDCRHQMEVKRWTGQTLLLDRRHV